MWLDAALISALTGVAVTHPQFDAAIDAAELLITNHTGCAFGSSAAATVHASLSAPNFVLPLPRADITAISSVTRGSKTLVEVFGLGTSFNRVAEFLELINGDGQCIPWQSGRYTLEVTQGFTVIPGPVSKAGALLVAWFVDLSDPERSRYEALGIGDFVGTMRRDGFPVPEAAMLLSTYRSRVGVSL